MIIKNMEIRVLWRFFFEFWGLRLFLVNMIGDFLVFDFVRISEWNKWEMYINLSLFSFMCVFGVI